MASVRMFLLVIFLLVRELYSYPIPHRRVLEYTPKPENAEKQEEQTIDETEKRDQLYIDEATKQDEQSIDKAENQDQATIVDDVKQDRQIARENRSIRKTVKKLLKWLLIGLGVFIVALCFCCRAAWECLKEHGNKIPVNKILSFYKNPEVNEDEEES